MLPMTKKEFRPNKKISAPKTWWMNLGCEDEWNVYPKVLPKIKTTNLQTIANMDQHCLLLADPGDTVLLKSQPPEAYLHHITKFVPKLPTIQAYSNQALALQKKGNIMAPFGITEGIWHSAQESNNSILGPDASLVAKINNKIEARQIAHDIGLPNPAYQICSTCAEMNIAFDMLEKKNSAKCIVVKEPYGSSGQGLFIAKNPSQYKFLQRYLQNSTQFTLLVEKWYNTIVDLNYQIFLQNDGTSYFIPPKRQCAVNGVYNGCDFLSERELIEVFEPIAEKIAHHLFMMGYWGMASIDAIITAEEIFPIIEINGRFSLSTYISFMFENVPPSISSRYFMIRTDDDFESFVDKVLSDNMNQDSDKGSTVYSFQKGYPGRVFMLFWGPDQISVQTEIEKTRSILSEYYSI